MSALPTPSYTHLKNFKNVYPPAEDTFLLLDALEKDCELISNLKPTICLEIGCGSGVVITFLARLNGPSTADINVDATAATVQTAAKNDVRVDPIVTDLTAPIRQRLRRQVDVVIFNPPYVLTPSEEVGSHSIAAAWAGGIDGREVTDRALPFVDEILSDRGVFYLVLVIENKPAEVMDMAREKFSWKSEVVLSRRAGTEGLSIIRFSRI